MGACRWDVLHAGVDGILPHHARQLSDAASSMCACLKALLHAHPPHPGHEPPFKRAKQSDSQGPLQHDDSELPKQHLQQQHSIQQQEEQQQQQQLQDIARDTYHQQQQEQLLQQQHLQMQEGLQQQLPTECMCKDAKLASVSAQQVPVPVVNVPPEQSHDRDEPTAPHREVATQAAQAADGMWQVLVNIATVNESELCQQLAQQCRDEDMQISPDLALADQSQLESLAATSHFHMAGATLTGKQHL